MTGRRTGNRSGDELGRFRPTACLAPTDICEVVDAIKTDTLVSLMATSTLIAPYPITLLIATATFCIIKMAIILYALFKRYSVDSNIGVPACSAESSV